MRLLHAIPLAMIAPAAFALLPGCRREADVPRNQLQGNSQPVISLTAIELTQAYIADPRAAEKDYLAKVVEVEGVIKAKASDETSCSVDLVGAENPDRTYISETVHCRFNDKEAVEPLRVEQAVTIRGTCSAKVANSVMLHGCVLVEAGPVPEDVPVEQEEIGKEEARRRKRVQAEAVKRLQKMGVDAEDSLGSAEISLTEGNFTEGGRIKVEILAELKNLYDFGKLDLAEEPISDAGLDQLAELKTLKKLELDRVENVTDAGLVHVGKMTGLETLSLKYNPQLTDAGLARLKPLRGLIHLTISPDEFGNPEEGISKITDAGIAHLAVMTRLETLELPHARLTDAGMAALEEMKRLKELNLRGTLIEGPGLKHLAATTRFLNLQGTQLDDRGLRELAGRTELARLNLTGTRITDAGLVHLKGMTGLDFLLLADTNVTDAGMLTICELENLTLLNLKGTQVGNAGMAPLGRLPKLSWLILVDTNVGDRGLTHLARLKTLENLYLSKEPKATKTGISRLKLALPDVKVSLTEGY